MFISILLPLFCGFKETSPNLKTQAGLPERLVLSTKLHGVTFHNNVILTLTKNGNIIFHAIPFNLASRLIIKF